MMRHVFRLIWNRKRANGLIIVELALAFLIVFFVAALGFHSLYLWNQPLGFEYEDTLELMISTGGAWEEDDDETLRQVIRSVRDQPEVEWAHVSLPPFRNWRWRSTADWNERSVQTGLNFMTDGGPADFGVELVEGRWFDEGDEADGVFPVVIDRRLAEALFPDGVELGANINDPDEDDDDQRNWKVLGVFDSFRQHGELSALTPYLIGRFSLSTVDDDGPSTIQVRVEAGTPVEYEERLQAILEAEAPSWTVNITPLDRLRQRQIKDNVIPLTILSIVAAFLLLMVAFGLFGVLWQSVTRRTDELGLRRAVGATRRRIYRQIVFETLVLASLAAAAGTVVAVQFPIASSSAALGWRPALVGAATSTLLMLLLAAICSAYPAWLASRRAPADALHYE